MGHNDITIEQLKSLFELVIKKLQNDNLKEFNFSTQEYWFVAADEWDNFEETPVPIVGSLVDDIAYLKKTIRENEMITYSDFDRLASVFRAISEMQAPVNN